MDPVSLLPIELAHKIFQFLEIKDLYQCMSVCKSWRNLINCNYVWSHFYKEYDIEQIFGEKDEDSCETKILSPLCSGAIELKNFLLSPAFNWKLGRSSSHYINLMYRQWRVVCCDPYIAILYPSFNKLHIFYCFPSSVECIDVISTILPLDTTDLNRIVVQILINKNYIVISAYSITAVYKCIENRFKLYKCFASKRGSHLICTDHSFERFIQEHLIATPYLYERSVLEIVLIDEVLWLTEVNGKKYIINLDNGEQYIKQNLYLYTKASRNSQYILHVVEGKISISDKKGTIITSFDILPHNNLLYLNDTILVIVYPWKAGDPQLPNNVECREILTGKLIRTFTVNEKTRIALHPKKSVLYLFTTKVDLYKVISLCIETGTVIWKYELRFGQTMSWGAHLSVLHERFLFVYPAPSSEDYYALFTLQGKLLYEDLYFTTGILLHFSDAVILGKEGGRLHVSTFY